MKIDFVNKSTKPIIEVNPIKHCSFNIQNIDRVATPVFLSLDPGLSKEQNYNCIKLLFRKQISHWTKFINLYF